MTVDQDIEFVTRLEHALRIAGQEVVVVMSTWEALSLVEIRKPGLMVIDLHAPSMDGIRLLKNIRTHSDFDAMPIVMCTAHDALQYEQRVLQYGAQELIVKSGGITRTIARLRRWMRPGHERVAPVSPVALAT